MSPDLEFRAPSIEELQPHFPAYEINADGQVRVRSTGQLRRFGSLAVCSALEERGAVRTDKGCGGRRGGERGGVTRLHNVVAGEAAVGVAAVGVAAGAGAAVAAAAAAAAATSASF